MVNNPFKVGDKVECINSSAGHADKLTNGKIYTVNRLDGNDIILVTGDHGENCGAFVSRFKLAMNTFKAGDWVKLKNGSRDYHDILTGKAYEVISVDSNGRVLIQDEKEEFDYNPCNFELAAAPVSYSLGQEVKIIKEIKFCDDSHLIPNDLITINELNVHYFNNSGKQDCYELVKPEEPVKVGQKYKHNGGIFVVAQITGGENPASFLLIDVDRGVRITFDTQTDINKVFGRNGKDKFELIKE